MDPATALAWALLTLAAAAALVLVILIAGLALVFARAPRLAEQQESGSDTSATATAPETESESASASESASLALALANTSLTVVVPAYNEAANIAACLTGLLDSKTPCGDWRVLLVDDRSSDATLAIAQEAAGACGATEPRVSLLAALVLALAGIGLQLVLRLWIRRQFLLPITFWWLMGAGGLVVAAIGPVSVWRTLSGRGWTWKGRPLA